MGADRPTLPRLGVDAYAAGVLTGDRATLGRAITLVESDAPRHRPLADALLADLMPHIGATQRIGITGVPGVGKSTFIDAFGSWLTARGHRVAVLAVDPSSQVSGGSILGDKTRMQRLANDPRAFVRPSPASGSLGGVTRKAREALLVCEAAGYDVVLVETVGVGQSETVVAEMVDFMVVLMLAGAGDELQGIKRGILEVADMVAINKADDDNAERASVARRQLASALRLMRPRTATWQPRVVTCSGRDGRGLDEIWAASVDHAAALEATGEREARRREQRRRWMWAAVDDELGRAFRRHPAVAARVTELEARVVDGLVPPTVAAQLLLKAFGAAVDGG